MTFFAINDHGSRFWRLRHLDHASATFFRQNWMPTPVKAAHNNYLIDDLEPEGVGKLIEIASPVLSHNFGIEQRIQTNAVEAFLHAIKEFFAKTLTLRLVPFGSTGYVPTCLFCEANPH
jgi:hypothetical protein